MKIQSPTDYKQLKTKQILILIQNKEVPHSKKEIKSYL